MYAAYQAQSDLMWPLRTWAKLSAPILGEINGSTSTKQMAAACRLIELAEVKHKRPPWRIDTVPVKGEKRS